MPSGQFCSMLKRLHYFFHPTSLVVVCFVVVSRLQAPGRFCIPWYRMCITATVISESLPQCLNSKLPLQKHAQHVQNCTKHANIRFWIDRSRKPASATTSAEGMVG